jgi:DNA-binding PadR family transcriptional regulator
MNVAGGTKPQGSGPQARVYSLTPRGVEEEEGEGEE